MVAKSKTNDEFGKKTAHQSPIALSSSASHSLGTRKAHSSVSDRLVTGRPGARGLNENTASSSHVWHSDANTTQYTRKTSLCWSQERSTKTDRGFVTRLMEP